MSPWYADPDIWKNLKNQIKRIGMKDTKSDIFSLGRALRKVLPEVFKHKAIKYGIDIDSLLQEMEPKKQTVRNKEELNYLERKFPHRVIAVLTQHKNIVALIYPENGELYDLSIKILNCFSSILKYKQIEGLKGLVMLVCSIQRSTKALGDFYPSLETVIKVLEGIKSSQTTPVLSEERVLELKPIVKTLDFSNIDEVIW